MFIKQFSNAIVMTSAAIILTGCGNLSLDATPEEFKKNSHVKIYIDESKTDLKKDAFLDKYVEVLNRDDINLTNYRAYQGCEIVPGKKDLLYTINWNKNLTIPFDKGQSFNCDGRGMNKDFHTHLQTRRISPSQIEILTDGTIDDALNKYIAASVYTQLIKKTREELYPYGSISMSADIEAMKHGRLILNTYFQTTKIKDLLSNILSKKGYYIVDNYSDADRSVFIETLATVPKQFSGGYLASLRKDRLGQKMVIDDINNIKTLSKLSISRASGQSSDIFPLTLASAGILGSSLSGGNNGNMAAAGLVMFGLGVALQLLSDDSVINYSRNMYKIIVENKHPSKDGDNDAEKYKYIATLYYSDLRDFYIPNDFANAFMTYRDGIVAKELTNFIQTGDMDNQRDSLYIDYDDINL